MSSPSNRLGLFVDLTPSEYRTLAELGNDYPEEGELLCNYTTPLYWDTIRYGVVRINPVEWYTRVISGGLTIKEAFEECAEGWQKRLVKSYRSSARELADEDYLFIDSAPDGDSEALPTLVDGFHRLAAMALEGVTCAFALDLAQFLGDPLGEKVTGHA